MCKFSEDSKQKLGNAIIYIANHTEQLSKTKLLKLLFLMEEYMVKRYHVPFMGLPFEESLAIRQTANFLKAQVHV